LCAVFILTWLAWAAFSSSWVAFAVGLSTSSSTESSGVATIITFGALVAFLGFSIAFSVGYFLIACIFATQGIWELTIVAY
jgi:uncharacterized membrane protein YagU involved in acid resistance